MTPHIPIQPTPTQQKRSHTSHCVAATTAMYQEVIIIVIVGASAAKTLQQLTSSLQQR